MENYIVSKILDKYLPADGVGTEREALRINLHRELSSLVQEVGELRRENKKQFDRINQLEDLIVDNGLDQSQNP